MPQSVFSDAYAAVVDHLVALRKQKGVSQVELARRLGRTQQLVLLLNQLCVIIKKYERLLPSSRTAKRRLS